MNIRLDNSSIRFRISNDEHAQLLAGHSLTDKTALPDGAAIEYTIIPDNLSNDLKLENDSLGLTLHVSQDHLQTLINIMPRKAGVETQHVMGDTTIKLSLEVDVKTKRRKAQ